LSRFSAFFLSGLLALAGCATTEQANEVIQSRYMGQPVDRFFLDRGPPIAEHRLNDGRMMYLWTSGTEPGLLPSSATGFVTMIGSTAWWTGWGTAPGAELECRVRIVASRSGRIVQILTQRDTIGWWELSRCHEIFKG
jgi:hypothetical protein